MAFDPLHEDYQRLGLRFADSLDGLDELTVGAAYATFGHRYAQSRDSLPQTDEERAFHLVADAAGLIDYQLPFASDEEAETMISRAHALLEEALTLDPHCHDAVRMLTAAQMTTFEDFYVFLKDNLAGVKASCLEKRDRALKQYEGERLPYATRLAMAPYLRWLAMTASKAVICGRNREALRFTDELLELDPEDQADARFSGAFAYAKLEDDQGLDAFEARQSPALRALSANNVWFLLARASLAFRRYDHDAGREFVRKIVDRYPHAVVALAQQREFPDGIFARQNTAEASEDELVIACSEATVLFQEGRDAMGRGSFGSWMMMTALGMATKEDISDLADFIDQLYPNQGFGLGEGGAASPGQGDDGQGDLPWPFGSQGDPYSDLGGSHKGGTR